MLERFLSADSSWNGRFLAGISTTGIYCLPSCPAKKARPENISFFRDREAAQRAGLRACRRCRPDDYYERRDPDVEALSTLFAATANDPSELNDADALQQASGFGSSKFNELVRKHWHSTPHTLLRRWKIAAAAKQLLETRASIADIAFASGFESLSVFNESFRRLMFLTPGDYRELGRGNRFILTLPRDYRSGDALRIARRLDARDDAVIARGVELDDAPAVVTIQIGETSAECQVESEHLLSPSAMAEAHRIALRVLGLATDPEPFEGWLGKKRKLSRLIAPRRGLRIPLTTTPFEALLWSIVGQQVNVTFASALHRELIELCGRPFAGTFAYPSAAAVAKLDYGDLTQRRFSRGKAEYLIDAARLVADGSLDLAHLAAGSASMAMRRLRDVRGIGVWSGNYILMRGFGFEDCAPLGDTGLSSGLQLFFQLRERPNAERVSELMENFAPYRSFATLHLWQVTKEEMQR